MSRVILALVVLLVAVRAATTEARAVEVYLFRGAGDFSFIADNAHFSRGLERIADQLNRDGIHAEVRRHSGAADALRTILRRRPDSVAIVGHSMGALAAMRLARKLRDEGVRVAYLATLDIPGPVGRAGGNVEWAENYYSMTPTFALLTNTRSPPERQKHPCLSRCIRRSTTRMRSAAVSSPPSARFMPPNRRSSPRRTPFAVLPSAPADAPVDAAAGRNRLVVAGCRFRCSAPRPAWTR